MRAACPLLFQTVLSWPKLPNSILSASALLQDILVFALNTGMRRGEIDQRERLFYVYDFLWDKG